MIKKSDVPSSVADLYVVPNPSYYQLIKIGKDPRFHSKTKVICSWNNLPPGAAYWSAKAGSPLSNDKCFEDDGLSYPNSVLKMRDYQVKPTEKACRIRAGIIEAPTGSGKSACAAKIIEESGQKTVVLCHSIELMLQMAKDIGDFLGAKPTLFYGKKKELGDITVTTYMSIAKNLEQFCDYEFSLLIVDEADVFVTDRYISVLCNLPVKRAFGFTATLNVEKYDSNMRNEICLMERLWGKVIEIETKLQTDILEKIIFTDYEKEYVDRYGIPIISKEWALFRKNLDEDPERREAQISLVAKTVSSGDFAIVLLDRVADVEKYHEELSSRSEQKVYKLHGTISDPERKRTVAEFKELGGILVANVKIAGRGFSVPEANKAFIFCPMRGETPIRQAIGRILRWIPNKKAILYDWADSSLAGQVKKRKKVYREFFPKAIQE